MAGEFKRQYSSTLASSFLGTSDTAVALGNTCAVSRHFEVHALLRQEIQMMIIIISSFYSLWSIGDPWRASKRCGLQLSPSPHSMIFLCFLFRPLLSFATFSLACRFFYIPEDSNPMQFYGYSSLFERSLFRWVLPNLEHLTLRRLMSYINGAPILDVSRSHTTTQHSQ